MLSDSSKLFSFISDDGTKSLLANDINDLRTCMENKQWKLSIIIVGSLIEAVLYYYIDSIDVYKEKIPHFEKRKINLSDLLKWARDFNFISDQIYKLSEPIRDYRNLIHVRVQQRLQVQVTENLVQIAYNLLLEIIHNIKSHHKIHVVENPSFIVNEILLNCASREADEADFNVYNPIIQKYGINTGK